MTTNHASPTPLSLKRGHREIQEEEEEKEAQALVPSTKRIKKMKLTVKLTEDGEIYYKCPSCKDRTSFGTGEHYLDVGLQACAGCKSMMCYNCLDSLSPLCNDRIIVSPLCNDRIIGLRELFRDLGEFCIRGCISKWQKACATIVFVRMCFSQIRPYHACMKIADR